MPNDRNERTISAGASQPLVKLDFGVGLAPIDDWPFRLCRFSQGRDLGPRRLLRRQRRDLALDEPSRTQKIDQALLVAARQSSRYSRLDHEDARADLHFDEPLHLKRDERLAHRGPRDAELSGENPLRGQSMAAGKLARGDEPGDLVGYLLIKTAVFDGANGHDAPCGMNERTIQSSRFGTRRCKEEVPQSYAARRCCQVGRFGDKKRSARRRLYIVGAWW
jgi:hypothetical protein